MRLLGDLNLLLSRPQMAMNAPADDASKSCLKLAETTLGEVCHVSKLESMELIEVEAACFFAARWIPHLADSESTQRRLERLIMRALTSVSHFVRTAAVDVVTATCNRESNLALSKTILDALLQSTEPRTALDVISSVSGTVFARRLVADHPSVGFIWRSLKEKDQLLAESARCALRAFIRNSSGSLLLPQQISSPDQLVATLDATFSALLTQQTDKRAVSAAIALLRLHPPQPGDLYAFASTQWCTRLILQLLDAALDCEASMSTSDYSTHLQPQNREFVIEQVTGILLSSHQQGELPQQLLHSVFPKLLIDANSKTSRTPAQWQSCIKFAHLLSAYWKVLSPNYDLLVDFIKVSLHNVHAPLIFKIVLFDVLTSICTCTIGGETTDWTLFDRLLPELLPLRFAHAWEVRDSLAQLFSLVLLRARDVHGAVDRHLIPAICGALGDDSEHVRATALTTIGEAAKNAFLFGRFLLHSPTFLELCFTTIDSQDSSRIAQCRVISQMLSLDYVVDELESRMKDKPAAFEKVLLSMFADEDYEVRHAVIGILEVMAQRFTRLSAWWHAVQGSGLLKKALRDESRLVRLNAWTLVRFLVSASENGMYPSYASDFQEYSLEAIDRHIQDQKVEASYDPDDEVYPLAPGVADNDLDCPF